MKYYIGCDTATDVKALCIMDECGITIKSEQFLDEKEFEKRVEELSLFYGAIKIDEEVEFKPREVKTVGKIPNITSVIAGYLKTDKGKRDIIKWAVENDALNWELIEELRNFKG